MLLKICHTESKGDITFHKGGRRRGWASGVRLHLSIRVGGKGIRGRQGGWRIVAARDDDNGKSKTRGAS